MSIVMAYEAKDNSGTLFRNDRRTNDNHPHVKGKALVAGRWYYVSAWTKQRQGGAEKFQSLAFTEMTDEQAAKEGGHRSTRGGPSDGVPGSTTVPRNGPPPRRTGGPRQAVPADAPYGDDQQFKDDDIPF